MVGTTGTICSPMEHMRPMPAGTEWPLHLPKQAVGKWLVSGHGSPPATLPSLGDQDTREGLLGAGGATVFLADSGTSDQDATRFLMSMEAGWCAHGPGGVSAIWCFPDKTKWGVKGQSRAGLSGAGLQTGSTRSLLEGALVHLGRCWNERGWTPRRWSARYDSYTGDHKNQMSQEITAGNSCHNKNVSFLYYFTTLTSLGMLSSRILIPSIVKNRPRHLLTGIHALPSLPEFVKWDTFPVFGIVSGAATTWLLQNVSIKSDSWGQAPYIGSSLS